MVSAIALGAGAIAHLIASVAMLTPGSAHTTRYCSLLFVIPLVYITLRHLNTVKIEDYLLALWIFGFGLHYHVGIITELSPPSEMTVFQRWKWAWMNIFSPQRDIKANKATTNAAGPRSCSRFVCQKTWTLIWTLVVYEILEDGWIIDLYIRDRVPDYELSPWPLIISGASLDHFVLRSYITIYSIGSAWLGLLAAHSAWCLAAVLFGGDVDTWDTPLFGSISEAYSLRRFYSHFWHKAMRKGFTVNAVWFVNAVLGVRVGSIFGRVLVLYSCFALSGIMHTVISWSGDGCDNWLTFWYYIGYPTAIVIEIIVQRIYRLALQKYGVRRRESILLLERLSGYAWVFLYHIDVLPRVLYPVGECHAIKNPASIAAEASAMAI